MSKVKIRVVLDTSVLISALKTKNPQRSPAWRVLKALRMGRITNFISKDIAEEMQVKLFEIGREINRTYIAEYILTLILHKSKMARPRRKFSADKDFVRKLGDVSDAKFFDVAYAKKVDYLITEDRKHILKLRDENREFKFNGHFMKILTPKEFVREVLEWW